MTTLDNVQSDVTKTCTMEGCDGKPLTWNVSAMLEYIRERGQRRSMIVAMKLWGELPEYIRKRIDTQAASIANYTIPGVIIHIGGKRILAEGKEKLYRATKERLKLFPVYELKFEDHVQFLVDEEMVENARQYHAQNC